MKKERDDSNVPLWQVPSRRIRDAGVWWWCMCEDEETGVAESWQEIIFRVHQPPPAQSAEKQHSFEAQHGGRRRESATESGRARGREHRRIVTCLRT